MDNTVFIVVKQVPAKILDGKETYEAPMNFNEGVFSSEKLAENYVKRRKASRDRDDRGCEFKIEPWLVFCPSDSFNYHA